MGTDGLARRIARLKAANPGPCETCGVDPVAKLAGYRVEWMDADKPDEPEYCEGCGGAKRTEGGG